MEQIDVALTAIGVVSQIIAIPCITVGCIAGLDGQGEGGTMIAVGFGFALVAGICAAVLG